MNFAKRMVIGPARRKLKKPRIKKMPKKSNQPDSAISEFIGVQEGDVPKISNQPGDECKKPRKFPPMGNWLNQQYKRCRCS